MSTRRDFRGITKKDTWIFGFMLFSALCSLLASFVLSWDAIKLAANPNADLSCNINALISCGAVGKTWQAQLLGFPNAFFGMMCEPVVITIAIAGLSGVKFKRWFLCIAQVVYLCGLIFALWLFYQSAFVIHIFCPWCLLVTLGTTMTFFTLLRYNIIHENLFFNERIQKIADFAVQTSIDFAMGVLIIVSIISIIFLKYGASIFS